MIIRCSAKASVNWSTTSSTSVICGEAEDRAGAMAAAERTNPDLAVVDLSLKEERGLELIKDFRARFPDLLILVLSMHDEQFYAERALRAGARGYIMKREASEKVLEAIRHVLDGGVFASPAIAGSTRRTDRST